LHLPSLLRVAVGSTLMAISVVFYLVVVLVLLPSRNLRIRAGNVWARLMGRTLFALSSSPLTIVGAEHLRADRPAIYVANHTSALDALLAMFLSPVGTVGVAKREIAYIPFFGQLYLLSGHVLIDRGHNPQAVATMTAAAALVRRHRLSLFMWPEGTRARDGRLQPLKKGLVHLARETGLPVVPIVVSGAHLVWRKNELRVDPHPVRVEVLAPLSTAHWGEIDLEQALEEVHRAFREHLPPDQRPLEQPDQRPLDQGVQPPR
jgi:lysophosphatidate acyltransferase